MAAARKKQVTVEAGADLEIAPGLVLPKGIYPAIETTTSVPTLSGAAWTAPEYSLELNEGQITQMGGNAKSYGIREEFDVTGFVLSHRLKLV